MQTILTRINLTWHNIYSALCFWTYTYIGETSRQVNVREREDQLNIKLRLVGRSGLADHTLSNHGQRQGDWNNTTSICENNTQKRKLKEPAL